MCVRHLNETDLVVAHALRKDVCTELQVALNECTPHWLPLSQLRPHLLDDLVQPRNLVLGEPESSFFNLTIPHKRT